MSKDREEFTIATFGRGDVSDALEQYEGRNTHINVDELSDEVIKQITDYLCEQYFDNSFTNDMKCAVKWIFQDQIKDELEYD